MNEFEVSSIIINQTSIFDEYDIMRIYIFIHDPKCQNTNLNELKNLIDNKLNALLKANVLSGCYYDKYYVNENYKK